MIDIENEELLTLAEASCLPALRVKGKPPTLCALWRWRTRGSLSASREQRVRLESVRLPGGTYTSREAVARLIAALNDDEPAHLPAQSHSLTAAERELAAAGIG